LQKLFSLPFIGLLFLYSCGSDKKEAEIPTEDGVLARGKNFINTDSTIEFEKEKSTDHIIIYKDSNELNAIRDSLSRE